MTIEEVSWEVVATEDNEEAMEVVAMEEVATNNVVDMEVRVVSVEAIRVVNITTGDMVAVVVAVEAMQQDQVAMVGAAVEVEASRETMKIQYLLETLEMLTSVQLKTSSVGLA